MNTTAAQILLVEDARTFAKAISSKLTHELDCEITIAHSLKETKSALSDSQNNFDIAVLDLNLPDAPNGEVVDFVISKGLPIIVLTASDDDQTREKILEKKVVDYIFKRTKEDIDYLSKLIRRVLANRQTHVLIAEDSSFFRAIVKNILQSQLFIVHEAEDGIRALEKIKEFPQIQVALIDYNMPKMDGYELVLNLRKTYPKDELSIIAVSSDSSEYMVSKFLKYGANDYIKKPFSKEEFICRIHNNLEYLELVKEQKEMASRDHLTGVFNRRYLFEIGEPLHANAIRGNISFVVGMLDLDFFKKINDQYGHFAGDMVLRHFANTLQKHVRNSDIVARYGGEEFCVILIGVEDTDIISVFEKIRKAAEDSFVLYEKRFQIRYTVSIGICATLLDSLDAMMKVADEQLYEAKRSGRNKICADADLSK